MAQTDRDVLSQDVVFDLLSSARRRFVLYYLRQTDGPVQLRELADEVAAWENEVPVDELTSQQRKRVYVSLYQTHIPKLEDVGIVDYDRDAGSVALADRADDIGRYLGSESNEVPWQLYYLGLAVLGAVFYALVALDASVFAGISELVAGVVVVAVVGVVAVAHLVYSRYATTGIPPELVSTRR